MSPGTKLAAFALVLAAALGTGAAVGAAVGPIDVGGRAEHSDVPTGETPATNHDSDH
jgi:hypothetical protein